MHSVIEIPTTLQPLAPPTQFPGPCSHQYLQFPGLPCCSCLPAVNCNLLYRSCLRLNQAIDWSDCPHQTDTARLLLSENAPQGISPLFLWPAGRPVHETANPKLSLFNCTKRNHRGMQLPGSLNPLRFPRRNLFRSVGIYQ